MGGYNDVLPAGDFAVCSHWAGHGVGGGRIMGQATLQPYIPGLNSWKSSPGVAVATTKVLPMTCMRLRKYARYWVSGR